MAPVTIYTKPFCPYCTSALELLDAKGVNYLELNISGKPELRAEMIQRSGGRMTVPQIFAGDRHLGGCDDIYALEGRGELDTVLAG
jgi:glutaredoxin 3